MSDVTWTILGAVALIAVIGLPILGLIFWRP